MTIPAGQTAVVATQVYKLHYGATAALWRASDNGPTLSGVFRDMADFAVL